MRYRGRLRQELSRCMVGGQIDCLMLQEHHLSESRIRRCGSLLARHSEVFWSASFGPSGVQGGVCISIADSWREPSWSEVLSCRAVLSGLPCSGGK